MLVDTTSMGTHEFDDAEIGAPADQRQGDGHLAQPGLGDRQREQHIIFRRDRNESVIQRDTGFARLLVDELPAHPVLGSQIGDRHRARQRLNGEIQTVTFRQHRGCATTHNHHDSTAEKIAALVSEITPQLLPTSEPRRPSYGRDERHLTFAPIQVVHR